MQLRTIAVPVVRGFNAGMVTLSRAPWIGPRMRHSFTEITYVGRKSGRTITTPVSFRRSGDEVLIGVGMPDQKTWWRNFRGDGGQLSLELDGVQRTGHAVADRNERGQVTVQVRLD